MRKLILLLALLLPSIAFAQGGSVNGGAIIVLGPTGRPLAGATVTICASGATGIPCSPTITVYSDPGLTTPTTNPQTSDGNGNVFVYAAPGTYTYTVTGTGIKGKSYTATVAGSGGGNVISSATNNFSASQNFNAGFSESGAYTTTGAGNHGGTETFLNQLLLTGSTAALFGCRIENIRYVDAANLCGWTGSDVGAWTNAAEADLPASGGIIFLPNTSSALNQTTAIVINKPIYLVGHGAGASDALSTIPTDLPATRLLWTGTVGATMVTFTASGQSSGGPLDGAGFSQIKLDGNAGNAAILLKLASVENFSLNNFYLTCGSSEALDFDVVGGISGFISNGPGLVENGTLREVDTGCPSGHGILMTSSNAPNDTDNFTFNALRIQHKNGDGIHVTDADTNTFINTLVSRASGGAGIGVSVNEANGHLARDLFFYALDSGPGGVTQSGAGNTNGDVHFWNKYEITAGNATPAPTISGGNATIFYGGDGQAGGFYQVGYIIDTGAANPPAEGFLRLPDTEHIAWQNHANNRSWDLSKDTNDNLTWPNSLILGGSGNPAGVVATESTAPPGCTTSVDCIWPDSTAHALKGQYNGTETGRVPLVIASGTSTLTSGAVTAATCQTAVTTAATNTANTDSIEWSYATAPTLTTDALLHISPYVTSGNVNFTRCNPTAASITGTAIVINWRVIR